MSELKYDIKGRPLTEKRIHRAAIAWNFNILFGCIAYNLIGPGSNMLTIFMSEWLVAPATAIGFIISLNYFGPIIEPLAAPYVQNIRYRRKFIIVLNFFVYMAFSIFIFIPFLGKSEKSLFIGIVAVLTVCAVSRASHLGTPASWSLLGDFLPESKREWFFGLQQSLGAAGACLGFFLGSVIIDNYGGTQNPYVMASIFAGGTLAGLVSVSLFFKIPEIPVTKVNELKSFSDVINSIIEPAKTVRFRKLIIAIAVLNFSIYISAPFSVLYLRGSQGNGETDGLGATMQLISFGVIASSVATVLAGRFWGWFGERIGPKWLVMLGSIGFGWLWLFFFVTPEFYTIPYLAGQAWLGFFSPAITIGSYSCAMKLSTQENRGGFMAAFNAGTFFAAAIASTLGGYIVDKFPVVTWVLPSGMAFTYIHLLTCITTVGIAITLIFVIKMPLTNVAQSKPGIKAAEEHAL